MIDSLRVKNFQIHGAESVEFTPGINTIVGDSDAGKSSLLRAIRWVAQNRPAGAENTKHGETDCRAMLVSGGHKATRVRTADKNGYLLDGKEYLAIGQAVPPDVSRALALSDVNFQAQSDGWFWFSLSAGERSRELNKVVDLDAIDTALTQLASIAKRRQTAVEVAQDREKAANAALEALDYVPDVALRVTHLEDTEAAAVEAAEKSERLRGVIATAAMAGDARRQAAKAVQALEHVLGLAEAANEAHTAASRLREHLRTIMTVEVALSVPVPMDQWSHVEKLQQEATEARTKAETLRGLCDVFRRIKLTPLPTDAQMQALLDAEAEASEASLKPVLMRHQLANLSRLSDAVRKAKQLVADAETELAAIPVCPTCGKAVNDCDE